MCNSYKNLEEIYKTEFGAVFQCSSKNCYWLEFGAEWHPLKVSDFLFFKKEVDAIDVISMLNNPSPAADVVFLQSFRAKRCFILNAIEIIHLKELLRGAKIMIELNSVIRECLICRKPSVLQP